MIPLFPIGRRIFVAVVICLSAVLHAQPEKVLFIGNSFTRGAGGGASVPTIFDALANAAGHPDPVVVTRTMDGRTFTFHSTNSQTQDAINQETWTHAVLQDNSEQPTHIQSPAGHLSGGTALYNKVIAKSPTAKVILHETWARAAADELITGTSTPTTFATSAEMQYEVRTNYLALAKSLNDANPGNAPVAVAPVGDAWQIAGALLPITDPGYIDLFNDDDHHANDAGYYLAAAVIYSTIYGSSPLGLHLLPGVKALGLAVTDEMAARLEEVAWKSVGLYASPPPIGPWLTSASSPDGHSIELRLSKPLPMGTPGVLEPINYVVANRGKLVPITAASLSADMMTVTLTAASELRGRFAAGLPAEIPVPTGLAEVPRLWLASAPPESSGRRFFTDFGAADSTTAAANDRFRIWNNVTPAVGNVEQGQLPNLLAGDGTASTIGLNMVIPFTTSQKSGRQRPDADAPTHPDYPPSATDDALSGGAGVLPAFKITGLDPARSYTLVFYAIAGSVSNNRETRYTVTGSSVRSAALDPSGNLTRTAVVPHRLPSPLGELLIELSPTEANTSGGLTYLGFLQISEDPILVPEIYPPQVVRGQFYLDWKGNAALESCDDLAGSWTTVDSSPLEGYVSPLAVQPRFFRLRYELAQ